MDVVLLIHGIRTDAAWTSMVRSVLEEETNCRVVVLRYGYFDLLRFLFPFGTRSAPANRLARLIQNVRADEPTARVSVIAHSFGTYTITRILTEHRYIRISRLIMCGSVVPEDFRWEDIASQLERPVLNECGTLDLWPVFASWITVGFGATGTFGFGDPVVRDRYHALPHSGFFDKEFVRQNWVPFIRDGVIRASTLDSSRPSSPWWMPALSSGLARWAFLGILGLALLGGASALGARTSADPMGRFAYRLGIKREIPGGTAWVFLGYFGTVDTSPPHWIEGPHFRHNGEEFLPSGPPVLGARIKLSRSRRLMIHGWKLTREEGKFDLICAHYDDDSDDTGVRLPPDTVLVVREAPDDCTYGNGAIAIWVRVAYP